MNSQGWIKLHRNLIDWEYYHDKNCLIVLIHLLLTVNYKDTEWKGLEIKAGSRVISWENSHEKLGFLSNKQERQ